MMPRAPGYLYASKETAAVAVLKTGSRILDAEVRHKACKCGKEGS
jgi:hypothetical protein